MFRTLSLSLPPPPLPPAPDPLWPEGPVGGGSVPSGGGSSLACCCSWACLPRVRREYLLVRMRCNMWTYFLNNVLLLPRRAVRLCREVDDGPVRQHNGGLRGSGRRGGDMWGQVDASLPCQGHHVLRDVDLHHEHIFRLICLETL